MCRKVPQVRILFSPPRNYFNLFHLMMKRLIIILIAAASVFLVSELMSPTLKNEHDEQIVRPVNSYAKKIGFVGDSLTVGTGGTSSAVQSEIAALGGDYTAINRGLGGATTEDWLPGKPLMDSTLLVFESENIKTVSFMLGANDSMLSNISMERYEENVRSITSALINKAGVECIIINYPTYIRTDDMQVKGYITSYHEALDRIVNDKDILKGDTKGYDEFKERTDEMMSKDGVHFTNKGYQTLGKYWADAYRRAVSNHDCS